MALTPKQLAVDIELPNRYGRGGKLVIDGQDISAHTGGFTLTSDVCKGTQLTLNLPALDVTRINSPHTEVHVADAVARVLEKAGWTPPPGVASVLPRNENGCPCEWVTSGSDAPLLGRTVPTCPVHGVSRQTSGSES